MGHAAKKERHASPSPLLPRRRFVPASRSEAMKDVVFCVQEDPAGRTVVSDSYSSVGKACLIVCLIICAG